MAWAYIGNGEVLHIVDDLNTATEFAKSAVVETDHPHDGGYPTVVTDTGVEEVIYEGGQAYIHGNVKNGKAIATPPTIQAILDKINAV